MDVVVYVTLYQSKYRVSIVQWTECSHGTPKALGSSPGSNLTCRHLLHLQYFNGHEVWFYCIVYDSYTMLQIYELKLILLGYDFCPSCCVLFPEIWQGDKNKMK